MHRVYFTSTRLHKIYPTTSAFCWRCVAPSAGFIHVFLTCPQIKIFWTEVTTVILAVITIQIPLTVEVCLFGLVDPLAPRRVVRTLFGLLLYYKHKWKSSAAPSVNLWKQLIIQPCHYTRPLTCLEDALRSSIKCGTYGWTPQLQEQIHWRTSMYSV